MKKIKLLLTILLFVLSIGLTACTPEDEGKLPIAPPSGETGGEQPGTGTDPNTPPSGGETPPVVGEGKDYVSELKLNMGSESLKAEVTVKSFIDGDTVHFNIDEQSFTNGVVLKARFLAINTPESTGKIEEYGKQASNFTKEKLSNATSIIVESDDTKWNADSTGNRYMVWVWYKTAESNEYRNLNLEILQNGLAVASNTAQNRYGSTCVAALEQAKELKLKVFSGEDDPLFYYGGPQEIDLKELRTNIEKYVGTKVAFEAVIYSEKSQTLYVQDYFGEDEAYYGIQVYYGNGAGGSLLKQFKLGNRVRFVGTVQEWNGIYQVSGLVNDVWDPTNPENTVKVSEGNEIICTEITAEQFTSGKISVELEDEEGNVNYQEFNFKDISFHSYVEIKNLQVVNVYTTNNGGDSDGSMTLTCKVGGITIKVRTDVLTDSNGNIVTESAFNGKNISVKGTIEKFNDEYQIKVFFYKNITFNN